MPEAPRNPDRSGRDSISNTLRVAVTLSLVCSLLVASTAVLLKPEQLRNAEHYRQAIILEVAGMLEPDTDISAAFEKFEVRVVNLADGSYDDTLDGNSFNALEAASDPATGVVIPGALDLAKIRRRASHAPVYIVRDGEAIDMVILPVYGAGLWSTMYAYLAVAGDGKSVRGIRFYEHAETPGLGDQIDNAGWRAQWNGKQLFGEDGAPLLEVVRGRVVANDGAVHQVDGISGATLTGRGVTNLVRYWTGPHGFGPYLSRIQEANNGDE